MFSFQGTISSFKKKLIETSVITEISINFFLVVESTGIEPVTSCLQGRRSPSWANPPYGYLLFIRKWWAKMDSNHRPHDYQSCALASWAIGPYRHFFWWRVPGSNRWPPACKAGALPAELTPQMGSLYSGTLFLYPLNWITHWVITPCTDLRTLQIRNLSYLRSP